MVMSTLATYHNYYNVNTFEGTKYTPVLQNVPHNGTVIPLKRHWYDMRSDYE